MKGLKNQFKSLYWRQMFVTAGMVCLWSARLSAVVSSTWPSVSQMRNCTSDTVAAKVASFWKSRSFRSSSMSRYRPLSR